MHLRTSEVNFLCAEDGEMGECWWERVVRCGEIGNAVYWKYMTVVIGGGDTICGGYTNQISHAAHLDVLSLVVRKIYNPLILYCASLNTCE